jgi:hypothetical protein
LLSFSKDPVFLGQPVHSYGRFLMTVLSVWNIITVEECAVVCWCPSWCVECCGVTVNHLTLNLLMLHLCGVSKTFGEWYQKTNKTEDTNKLTLLALKIIVILHSTLLATFIKLLETVSKGLFRNRSQNSCHTFLDCRHLTNASYVAFPN